MSGGGLRGDIAEHSAASYEHHPVDDLEPKPEERHFDVAAGEIVYRMIHLIVGKRCTPRKAAIHALAMAHVLKISEDFDETKIAVQLGCSKQLVSRTVLEFKDGLELASLYTGKTPQARVNCRKAQLATNAADPSLVKKRNAAIAEASRRRLENLKAAPLALPEGNSDE